MNIIVSKDQFDKTLSGIQSYKDVEVSTSDTGIVSYKITDTWKYSNNTSLNTDLEYYSSNEFESENISNCLSILGNTDIKKMELEEYQFNDSISISEEDHNKLKDIMIKYYDNELSNNDALYLIDLVRSNDHLNIKYYLKSGLETNINLPEKRSASIYEISKINDYNPIIIFDLKITLTDNDIAKYLNIKIDNPNYNEIIDKFKKNVLDIKIESISNLRIDQTKTYEIIFVSQYKEFSENLNSKVNGDLVDYYLDYIFNNSGKGKINKEYFNTSTLSPKFNVYNDFILNKKITIKDDNNRILNLEFNKTLLDGLYTNPYKYYTCKNSEIVSYIFNKDLLKLPRYFTIVHARNILDYYKLCRDFYYSKLLNKTYINDDSYYLYERIYILYLTVQMFLNSDNKNKSNVEEYNDRDIYNFFESYGLAVLNNPDTKFIIGETELKKKIISNYNSLMKDKGSKNVLDKIIDIVSDGNTNIKISKFVLVQREDDKLYFVEVDYKSDNIIKETNDKLESGKFIGYNDFINKDPYWNETDVPEDELSKLDINIENTKYLNIYYKTSIMENIYNIRYILSSLQKVNNIALFDFLNKYNVLLDDGNEYSLYNIFNDIKNLMYLSLENFRNNYYIENNKQVNSDNKKIKYYGINIPKSNPFSKNPFKENSNIYKIWEEIMKIYENTKITLEGSNTIINVFNIKDPSLRNLIINNFSSNSTSKDISEREDYTCEIIFYMLKNLNYIIHLKNYIDIFKYNENIEVPIDMNNKDWTYKINKTILDSMVRFPVEYFNYYLNENKNSMNINFTTDLDELFKYIIDTFYLTDKDPLNYIPNELFSFKDLKKQLDKFLSYDGKISKEIMTDDDLRFVNEELLHLTDIINTLFKDARFIKLISFMPDVDQKKFNFIIDLIDIFRSYTTKIYDTKIDFGLSSSEFDMHYKENLVKEINLKLSDTFSTDEEIDIE